MGGGGPATTWTEEVAAKVADGIAGSINPDFVEWLLGRDEDEKKE